MLKKTKKKKEILNQNRNEEKTKISNLFFFKIAIFLFFSLFILFLFIYDEKPSNSNTNNNQNLKYDKPSKKSKYSEYEKYSNNNSTCDILDPINLIKKRVDNGPIEICEGKSKHICFINTNNYYNDIYAHKNGTICEMENIVLDPSNAKQSGHSFFNGPVDFSHQGFPILDKGFINAECKPNDISLNYNKIYETYFNSWNYEYNSKDEAEELEELAPGKIIFFISRNQDSPNLFHGHSEIVNVLAVIYLFDLDPKDIQVIFLESIEIPVTLDNKESKERDPDKPEDPFYYIYKDVISQGGEPLYIKNLKKKYKISKAFHIPINWDSPLYIDLDTLPKCDKISKTYKLYNDFVDKYMDLKPFEDKFITDNETFYYPESVIKRHESGQKFDKIVTVQWRRVWPKKRKNQQRIFTNALELTYKLSTLLPKNILIRLIDTAKLPMKDQISVMRNTDYLIGIHGAGLSLSIFLPHESIFNEFDCDDWKSVLGLMSALSGHKTYTDYIKSTRKYIDGNGNVIFDENEFIERVMAHMKENNFI